MQFRIIMAALFVATPLVAQQTDEKADDVVPIQDNSFLIEEAYNQPAGIVQHINTFALDPDSRAWAYSFTQEWPFSTQRHQLSYTIPIEHSGTALGGGFGDVALNYRYQLPTGQRTNLAVAPRVSVLLPTGEEAKERGAGGFGIQTNLPVSVQLGPSFVTHFNAGMTYTPSAKNATGDESSTANFNLGQSSIWLVKQNFNFMLEVAWNSTQDVLPGGVKARSRETLIAPGMRGALNFSSGLQIVPGIAVPFGLGSNAAPASLFFYLSLEHPFGKGSE